MHTANWRRRVFGPAAARVGVGALRPHDLRHTAASLAIAAGADVKAVQRMLGHASAVMTLDLYAGLFDSNSTRWPSVWTRRRGQRRRGFGWSEKGAPRAHRGARGRERALTESDFI